MIIRKFKFFIRKIVMSPFVHKALYFLRRLHIDIDQFFKVQKITVKLFGHGWKTNYNRIDVFINYECNIKCFNCNVMCRQAPADDRMSIEQIKKFIKESIDSGKKWKRITVIGGEPTLHPDILEILNLFIEYKKSFSRQTEIRLCTNGFGEKVCSVLSKIPEGIKIENSAKVSHIQEDFICFDNAPMDNKGCSHVDFSGGCLRTSSGGLSINKYGYYPCCEAGAIDRVFGFDKGLKILPFQDNAEMRAMLSFFCKYCGGFLYSGYKKHPGYASPTWKRAFEAYEKNKPQLSLY